MLVLSRKIGEVITVGNSVKITVLSYDRGVVRLGIEAPKEIPIHRKEVYDKIIRINKVASRTGFENLKNMVSSSEIGLINDNRTTAKAPEVKFSGNSSEQNGSKDG